MATKVVKISIGNGQSYEDALIYTESDMAVLGVRQLFDKYTFSFSVQDKFYLVHSLNVNVIHISQIPKMVDGAIPYERIVLNTDVIYGPGAIIPMPLHEALEIEQFFVEDSQYQPLVFTCPQGLMAVMDANVASLECAALSPKPRSMRGINLQNIRVHTPSGIYYPSE